MMSRMDGETRRMWLAVCPKVFEIVPTSAPTDTALMLYDRCELVGRGLITRDELTRIRGIGGWIVGAHALDAWLIEGGAPPDVAHALVRPLLNLDNYALLEYSALRLPVVAAGEPFDAGAVELFVSPTEAYLGGHTATIVLTEGRLDNSLYEEVLLRGALAAALESRRTGGATDSAPRLQLVIDRQTPWSTVASLLARAQEGGWRGLDARSLAPTPLESQVQVPVADLDPEVTPALEIVVTQAEIIVHGSGPSQRIASAEALPAALAEHQGAPVHLAISGDVRWQSALDVMMAVRGRARVVGVQSTIPAVYARLRQCEEIVDAWRSLPRAVGFVNDTETPSWFVLRLLRESPAIVPGDALTFKLSESIGASELVDGTAPPSRQRARWLEICGEWACDRALRLEPGQRFAADVGYLLDPSAISSIEIWRLSALRFDGVAAERWLADDLTPAALNFVEDEWSVARPILGLTPRVRRFTYELAERWVYSVQCAEPERPGVLD